VAETLVTLVNKTLPNAVAVIGDRGLDAYNQSTVPVIDLGSVSEYCLQHMQCPVIICKRLRKLSEDETEEANVKWAFGDETKAERKRKMKARLSIQLHTLTSSKQGEWNVQFTPVFVCVFCWVNIEPPNP
jgi:hypothetical protein